MKKDHNRSVPRVLRHLRRNEITCLYTVTNDESTLVFSISPSNLGDNGYSYIILIPWFLVRLVAMISGVRIRWRYWISVALVTIFCYELWMPQSGNTSLDGPSEDNIHVSRSTIPSLGRFTTDRISHKFSGKKPEFHKVVIIMTDFRFESSFTRNLLSATTDSIYFNEPLLPFGMNCAELEDHKLSFLNRLLNCNFTDLREQYALGFNATHTMDTGKCIDHGLCYAGSELLRRYSLLCRHLHWELSDGKFHPESAACGYPLQETILRQQCLKSKIIFAEVTRICSIDRLKKLYYDLGARGKEVYVIHLVRDPRATAFYQWKASTQKRSNAEMMCQRIHQSLSDTDHRTSGAAIKVVSDGRYMRVRFEDISVNAVDWTKKIFQFIDSSVPPEVEKYIREKSQKNTTQLEHLKNVDDSENGALDVRVARVNDSREDSWREYIPHNLAMNVQQDCKNSMKALGYIPFKDENELRNATFHFFE